MAADLEAMKKAAWRRDLSGSGNRNRAGPRRIHERTLQELVGLAFSHAERLGLQLALRRGPAGAVRVAHG